MERRHKMCKSHWGMKWSRSLGQGTCQVSTSRRSTMQDMVVVGLIVEELSNINVKCVKYRSRSPGQGTCQASRMRWSTMQGLVVEGLIFEEILNINIKCVSHWSAKYRLGSPGQGTCQISTSRKSTIQGLVVEGLILEDIWKGDIRSVKVNGAWNVGQGHSVKIPAESLQWGEALCKVWWL